jgi:hypothetical protein
MQDVGSISNCDAVLLTEAEIESAFSSQKVYEMPQGWSITTPSKGRSGSGRKNRGRKLPAGRLNRNWKRRELAWAKMPPMRFECLKPASCGSLYDFLLESRLKTA